MKRDVTQQATEYSRSHRRKKRWQQVMTGLAAVVVFCTTYALILPAITLEEPVCGLEEHAHTEACYTQVTSVEELELVCAEPVHVHDDTCYETVQTLICPLEEDENHQHDESCYETTVQLICEQPEHEHTDVCYETVTVPVDTKTLTCTIPEDENHTHTALCYGTWELTCGQEAHEHTEACYAAETDYSAESDPEADVETRTDWEATLEDVSLTGEYRQDVLAVAESQLGYQESLRNYMTDDNGICRGYSRYGAWYGDPYGDWSAMYAAFCLSYAQVEGMPLNSDCAAWVEALSAEDCGLYFPAEDHEPVPGDLIFFSTDGTGTPDRVGLVTARIAAAGDAPEQLRVIGGDSENRVRYDTYALDDEIIAGYAALPEQTFICGREGHVHTAFCYDSHGNVTCGKEEHIHTDICEAADAEQAELTFNGPDYTITVRYGADAALPEGVTLTAEEILPDSDAYQTYLDQTLQLLEAETAEQVLFARFFDIRFLTDSGEVEPAAPVEVTITYAETVDTPEPATCQAVHFAGDGAELLDAQTQTPEDGTTSFTHVQETFSVTGDVVSVAADYNSTDVGPNSLPVDYYVCIDGTWTCVGSTKTGWYSNRQNGEESLTNYNRDYITVAQAVSILGPYGFTGNEENPSRVTAYQQKSGHTKIYSDTDTVTVPQGEDSGTKILPLSVNGDHAGYNIYYLPNNSKNISAITSPDSLDKSANGFYTVTVYDAQGIVLTKSDPIFTGGSFTYDASANGTTNWLVAYGSGSTSTVTGSTITLSNITSTVTVSPSRGTTTSHSVTFKVMIDGQWQTVGSLPYYYSGTVNGSQRAYITSDMAAQFFGDFGYTAATAPEYHFGYSYNDIYEIYYANGTAKTKFCMDVAGGTIKEAQTVQLYTSNHSDAQIFRIWDAGNGYSFITPISNSSIHVNAYGYSTGDPSSTQLKLSSATNANSQWKVDTGSDGRTTFWSAIAPEDQVIDLNNANMSNGGVLQIWHSTGGARYWYLDQLYRISNDTASIKNTDGTWNIGLTTESNGDIVCYYMPAETASTYTKAAESEISTDNSCWSVTVRDDTNSVYSGGELSGMVRYVAPGGEATVTVRNAEGVLWGCRGVNGGEVQVQTSQSGGYTTFKISNIIQPIEVTATRTNPSFTVQYYANIDRYVLGSSGNLEIIDTSGKKLPTNSGTQSLLKLSLEATGDKTDQNKGNQTPLYSVKSEKKLTQMYTDGTYTYEEHPGLEYFDKLWEQANYKLDAVLVLKDGKSPDSMNDNDWWWYKVNQSTWDNITFTNIASEEKAPRQEGVKQSADGTYCILLEEGTVLRLRYETSKQTYTNQTNFHDYDITSGQNTDNTWRSGKTGINLPDNYVPNKESGYKFDGSKTADVFAFGNANCETGLGLAQWGGNNINAYNGQNFVMSDNTKKYFGKGVYKGCTFGLVTGLDGDGDLVWDQWITAPYLFNDGTANGKHSYNNGTLEFIQLGDTYTLTAANSTVGSRNKLEYFFNPSPSTSTTHTHIFTNNFWPMDSATDKTDPLMGAINSSGTCDVMVNGFWDEQNTVGGSHNGVRVPISDDGRAHNWFFGMNFALSFTLTEDYVGPLEYIFFGDDDLWVFLDNQLICDIGGVHSSVGEYVNLRDYLPNGSSGQHTLSFFYTERGASGSTCWMSFTLPSVTSAATGRDVGSLQIAKSLGGDAAGLDGEKYKFKVELLTAENGSALSGTYSYTISDKDENTADTYGSVKSGGTIELKNGETALIKGLPAGAFYRVTELSTEGYHITVNGSEGYIVSGKIESGAVEPAAFVNTPYYELPSTGGTGTERYTIGGLALVIGAGALLVYRHRKRGKGDRASS